MQVYFESLHPEATHLREWAVRRANATCRLFRSVSRVEFKLSDANGSGGPANKECQVELTIGDTGAVVATARTTDWHSALDWAVVRAARALPRLQRLNRKRLNTLSLAILRLDAFDVLTSPAGNRRVLEGTSANNLNYQRSPSSINWHRLPHPEWMNGC